MSTFSALVRLFCLAVVMAFAVGAFFAAMVASFQAVLEVLR